MAVLQIQRIPYSAPREQFIEALKKDGCVVVQEFTSLDALEQARQEVEPWLQKSAEKKSEVGGKVAPIQSLRGITILIRAVSYLSAQWRHPNLHSSGWTQQDCPREVLLRSVVPGG